VQQSLSAGYVIDDDPARVDLNVVWHFLSSQAYWGRWRSREDAVQQVRGAWRVVGAYSGQDMVGFARAVSDGIALAYLADVFVLPAHRGHGLGRQLVDTMIEGGTGGDFRWLLHTADAHGLYVDFGFAPPDSTLMERPSGCPAVLPLPS
jgi:GNAT superfamily N-acetyltransferase